MDTNPEHKIDNETAVKSVFERILAHYGLEWPVDKVALSRDDFANTTCVVNLNNGSYGIHFWYGSFNEVWGWQDIIEGRIRAWMVKHKRELPVPIYKHAESCKLAGGSLLPDYLS